MAWTAPMTFTSGTALTAAQLNAHLRDNLMATSIGMATTPGSMFITADDNTLIERTPVGARVNTSESSSITSYGDLATVGPTVTLDTGVTALVIIGCSLSNDGANGQSCMSWDNTGDTTIAAADNNALICDGQPAQNGMQGAIADLRPTLNAGTNTFTAKYRTGGVGEGNWSRRFIIVWPL